MNTKENKFAAFLSAVGKLLAARKLELLSPEHISQAMTTALPEVASALAELLQKPSAFDLVNASSALVALKHSPLNSGQEQVRVKKEKKNPFYDSLHELIKFHADNLPKSDEKKKVLAIIAKNAKR